MFEMNLVILFGLIMLLWQWIGEKILDEMQKQDGEVPIEILSIVIIAEAMVILTYGIFIFKILF